MATDTSEKIGLKSLLVYAQGQTGLNLCVTLAGLHLLFFYSDQKGLSPTLAGLAFFIALMFDALTDPWVGNRSDRARFRSGRRRPFFLAAIPMALCYFLLLSPPDLKTGLFAWFLVFYFLQLSARKLYETAYSALMPEITLDYDERTRLATYRQLCATVGDISGALLPFATAYFFARGTDFRVAGAICAVVVAGGALGVYSGVRERPEFATRERYSLTESIKSAMRNRPFVILLISTTLAVMAIQVPTVLLRFLAKYWVHDGNAAARWLIAYFAGGVVSYPFWFRITMSIEKKPAFVAAILANALTSLLFMALSPGNTYLFFALMFLSGFATIGIWVTQMSAAADVIEWDEERTGRRQEGAYAGITSMSLKIAVAVILLLVGPLMTMVGYVPGAADLSPDATENLRRLFSIAPAAIYLTSAIVFTRYPITRESHRQMRDRIAVRAATAAGTAAS